MCRLLRGLLWLVLAHTPTNSLALTGEEEGEVTTGFALTAPTTATHSYLQRDVSQYGLTADSLLGRYGVTARQVLDRYSPHLDPLETHLVSVVTGANMDTVHERYELKWGRYKVFGAYISLHTHSGKLTALHYDLPQPIPPEAPPSAGDYLSVPTLGFGDVPNDAYQIERRGLAVSGNFLVPAWEIERIYGTGEKRTLVLDAQTGAILTDQTESFALAHVYPHGPKDGTTVSVDLPDLLNTGFLDGKHFAVFAPTADEPRAQAVNGDFIFDPHSEALEFDQVMAYYSVTKAEAFFRERFGFSMQNVKMKVSTNALAGGKADNAQYIPPPEGPAIAIGMGNNKMQNLARDTDVVFHEFSHHVVYQHLKTTTGEASILHEGIADYYAYAINGDPYLGESIVPGQPYLRTGALDPDWRYDDPTRPRNRYALGQVLATVLWEIRSQVGEDMDQIVFEALPYLPRTAQIKDFLYGLFNADRDLFPLAETSADYGLYGQNQCALLNAMISRGFAGEIDGIDGTACSLDVGGEAIASDQRLAGYVSSSNANGQEFSLRLGGKTCSTIGVPMGSSVWFWLLAPLILSVWRRGHRRWI